MVITRRKILHSDSGFSLVEVLVVISIVVVVSTLALMNIGTAKKQLGRQNVARELKSAFERARFDSVKRRALSGNRASVVVTETSFTLNVDDDQDGVVETGSSNNVWMSDISIKADDGDVSTAPIAITTPITITFDHRGEVTSTPLDAIFLVCNGVCTSPTSSNSNLILVTKTGTVNLLPGGSTVPTFAPPAVTAVPVTTGVNPNLRVN